jgi:hypothetical protein
VTGRVEGGDSNIGGSLWSIEGVETDGCNGKEGDLTYKKFGSIAFCICGCFDVGGKMSLEIFAWSSDGLFEKSFVASQPLTFNTAVDTVKSDFV